MDPEKAYDRVDMKAMWQLPQWIDQWIRRIGFDREKDFL